MSKNSMPEIKDLADAGREYLRAVASIEAESHRAMRKITGRYGLINLLIGVCGGLAFGFLIWGRG